MVCPLCKAEYVDGITQCSDCLVPLVWSLPEEQEGEGEFVEWAPLVSAVNQADIAVIKSILESENILYYIQGEHHGIMQGSVNFGAIVHVEKNRLQDAQNLIQNLNFNVFGFSTRSSDDLK
jgi:hypothetical protein